MVPFLDLEATLGKPSPGVYWQAPGTETFEGWGEFIYMHTHSGAYHCFYRGRP